MYTPRHVERYAAACYEEGQYVAAEMLRAYAATLKAAQGGVTEARLPDAETMCACWITPATTDAETQAFLAGARQMRAALEAALSAEPAAQGEEGFDARKYVRHMADVLEAGGDLFKVDADLLRLAAAINKAANTAPPAQPAERVPDGLVPAKALRDLYRAYVRTLEAGRDRITSLGGDCDSVEHMERTDPELIVVRRILLAATPAAPGDGDGKGVSRG